ncbi:MAG: hypothetical protein H7X95_06590, partial [Deltaproteobacteria bacterium]|nr:hypothetical protein [Deltaproteobacteria bacterium]
MTPAFCFLVFAASIARAAPAGAPLEGKPRRSLKANQGFYDDAWALDSAGKRLAVIHTDRETFQRVQIFDLEAVGPEGANPVAQFDLPPPTRVVQSLVFPPTGPGLLLIAAAGSAGSASSASSASMEQSVVESVDNAGKTLGKTAPLSAFGFPATGADAGLAAFVTLVAFDRRAGRNGEVSYTVTP